jgi:plasmid stability protein
MEDITLTVTLPRCVAESLQRVALKHDRSVELEARRALRLMFEPYQRPERTMPDLATK